MKYLKTFENISRFYLARLELDDIEKSPILKLRENTINGYLDYYFRIRNIF